MTARNRDRPTGPQNGAVTDEQGTRRVSPDEARTAQSRRQFLKLLGGSAAASIGVSGVAGARESPVVSMAGDNSFDPIGLYVEPGTTVRFEITGGSHSATAYEDRIPAEATQFDSGVISEGGFEHTFDVPGTYDYYCRPHQSMGMVGRIIVGEPGGPAETTPIPDGAVPDSERIVEEGTVTVEEFDEGGGRKMGSGSRMMTGNDHGLMWLIPVGFFTVVLGLVGGVLSRGSRSGNTKPTKDESAMAVLRERYAQGEIDEDEFAERKQRLQRETQSDE